MSECVDLMDGIDITIDDNPPSKEMKRLKKKPEESDVTPASDDVIEDARGSDDEIPDVQFIEDDEKDKKPKKEKKHKKEKKEKKEKKHKKEKKDKKEKKHKRKRSKDALSFIETEAGHGKGSDDESEDVEASLYGSYKEKRRKSSDNDENISEDEAEDCGICGAADAPMVCEACEMLLCLWCSEKHKAEQKEGHEIKPFVEDGFVVSDSAELSEEAGAQEPAPMKSVKELKEQDDKETIAFWNKVRGLNKKRGSETPSETEEQKEKKSEAKQIVSLAERVKVMEKQSKSVDDMVVAMKNVNKVSRDIEGGLMQLESGEIEANFGHIRRDFAGKISQVTFETLMQFIFSVAYNTISTESDEKILLKMVSNDANLSYNRTLRDKITEFYRQITECITNCEKTQYESVITLTQPSHNETKFDNPQKMFVARLACAWKVNHFEHVVTESGLRCAITNQEIKKGESAFIIEVFALYRRSVSDTKREVTYWFVKKHPKVSWLIVNTVYAIWNYRNFGSVIKHRVKQWKLEKFPSISNDQKTQHEMVFPAINTFVDDKVFIKDTISIYIMLRNIVKNVCGNIN
jgi:hypothetical protein